MEKLKRVTENLIYYCQKNNWAGYDPYDALNSRIFEYLPFLDFKIPRLVLTQAMKRCPVNLRPLLLVPKTVNPKGLALFLMSLVKLSKQDFSIRPDSITDVIDQLELLRSPITSYWCWGYSFPWQTRVMLVPKGTPNLVCTVFVANALLDYYEINQQQRCLEMAVSAAEYVLNELYWEDGKKVAAFSYPFPSSRTPVHNANFLAAAMLSRVYKLTGEERFLDKPLNAARYSAAKQKSDGSWAYGEGSTQGWVDNFHTGYNLCAMKVITENFGTNEFVPVIHYGYDFYRLNFFREDGAPKYFYNKVYPIDAHSVAQSIITLLEFKDLHSDSIFMGNKVASWAVDNLWDERGYFYYQMLPYGKIKIPYMRWSEAWMLLAFATFLEHHDQVLEIK